MYIINSGYMTKMAAMTIYGKNSSTSLFSSTVLVDSQVRERCPLGYLFHDRTHLFCLN